MTQSLHEVIKTITPMLQRSSEITPLIKGPPGVGKSDICFQIGSSLGIPEDRILRVHINDYDVIDFTGVPSIQDGYTVFNPSKMFAQFKEGTGPGLIIVEELPQSSNLHQTWFAGFELERETPQFKLDPEVRIICTGNRKEDRAGTRPMLAHLNDRLWHFEVGTDVDDWVEWALDSGSIDYTDIMFIKWRPNLLNAFDPERDANPTQRSWTKVFTQVPKNVLPERYMQAAVQAKVGEGAATEYVGFLKIFKSLPDISGLIDGHAVAKHVAVPSELPACYALAGSLVQHVDSVNINVIAEYMDKFQPELKMLFWSLATRREPELKNTKAYVKHAPKNKDFF
jgi:hypothetical protein